MLWWQAQWNALAQQVQAGMLGERAMLQQFLTLLRGAKPLYATAPAVWRVLLSGVLGSPGLQHLIPQSGAALGL